jgi:Spy/CpxP family protein refolding chaperone
MRHRKDGAPAAGHSVGLDQPLLAKEQYMKTWMRRSLMVLGGTVLLGGLAACGHGGMGGGMGGMGHHGRGPMSEADSAQWRQRMTERVASELKLDAAQKAKLALLAEAMHAQRQALVANPGDLRGEVQALMAGPSFDHARAQAMVEAKTRAVQEKSPAVIAAAADFFDSLNPEQQQKVRDFMQRRGGRWGGRHG